MVIQEPRSRRRPGAVPVIAVLVVAFVVILVIRPEGDIPAHPVPTGTTSTSPPEGPIGWVTTVAEGTELSTENGPVTAGANLAFPVLAETGDGLEVLTNCNVRAWVDPEAVEVGRARQGETWEESVFVIDPGHGGRDLGAVGPTGVNEAEVNLDIAARTAALLEASQDVDWETGEVRAGDTYPAAAAALLTRHPSAPEDGDYLAGLEYRSSLANAAQATALMSVHNNGGVESPIDRPGTEAFYSVGHDASPRLAALLLEEVRRGLSGFDIAWTGGSLTGPRARVGSEGRDYYSLLGRATVPAAIVEGVYLTNPAEEAFAATESFRDAYAEGVYRALVRFVTTDDQGPEVNAPELFEPGGPSTSLSGCTVPSG